MGDPIPLPIEEPAPAAAPVAARVSKLTLTRFRNHVSTRLVVDAPLVMFVGPNGAGKTNILEALSFLAPGRGLRRAALDEVAQIGGDGSWFVHAEATGPVGPVGLGVGVAEPDADGGRLRQFRIGREAASSAAALADHVRVVWLTPAMDGLFAGSPGDRRRFLDRLVLAVDADHGARVNAFERALRSRNRLLEDPAADRRWLDAIEREAAELAVAVAAARAETVQRLQGVIEADRDPASPFPFANLALKGTLEQAVLNESAARIEDDYRAVLREGRGRDRAAGRTLEGPQASDLDVRHGPTGAPAARCSTGQQKALLVGLVLAHARLVAQMAGFTPLVLLDEVAAHLDPARREALFSTLRALGAQVWVTGADPAAFAGQERESARFVVEDGRVAPL